MTDGYIRATTFPGSRQKAAQALQSNFLAESALGTDYEEHPISSGCSQVWGLPL